MNNAQKKSPGRPRKDAVHRSADREAYVDAAFAIIRDGGSAALTARSVATRVGVSVGSVYSSFDSLEALRLQANAVSMKLLREHLAAALADGEAGTTEERLLCLAEAYAGFADAHRSLWLALFEPRTLEAPPEVVDGIEASFAALEAVLRDGAVTSEDDVRILARALWSSVHGMVFLGNAGSLGPIRREDVRAMVRSLVRAVLRGVPWSSAEQPATGQGASPRASGRVRVSAPARQPRPQVKK